MARGQEKLQEIIVVYNNSEDGTFAYLQTLAQQENRIKPTLIYERNAIRARNTGFGQARGIVTIHMDDDVLVEPEWLDHFLEPYRRPEVGGVGGRIIPYGEAVSTRMRRIVGKISPWRQLITNFDAPDTREVDFMHGTNIPGTISTCTLRTSTEFDEHRGSSSFGFAVPVDSGERKRY